MTFHALVVDDNPTVLEDVKDRLEALDHTCDCVACMQDARECLAGNTYTYILLDLEIPVQYGRRSRITNGQELLREIRSMKGHEKTPIIVMTSHGHDSSDLAAKVLRCDGANDFVKKPFTDTGDTLEKAIHDNLAASGRSHPGAAKRSGVAQSESSRPLEEGEMVFFESRVELCGVKICGGPEYGVKRRILDVLRHKNGNGQFVSYSGDELAMEAGCDQGQNAIAGIIRHLRDHVCEVMHAEANLHLDRLQDFIVNDRLLGYRFSPKITIRDAEEPVGKTREIVNDPQNDPLNLMTFNDRQRWAVEQLQTGIELRKSDLIAHFSCSESTAARDLRALRLHKIIEFFGPSRSGY